ncbi:MAG TPA: hypothetical protein VE081_14780, partial [Sporichthyaceae bacterium]|nr:hypothetical protein [Sporichthyaceae bacterium]
MAGQRRGLLGSIARRIARGGTSVTFEVGDEGDHGLITDPWDFYPELQPLRHAAAALDWPAIRDCLAAFDHPEDRAQAGDLLSDVDRIEEPLVAAVAQD